MTSYLKGVSCAPIANVGDSKNKEIHAMNFHRDFAKQETLRAPCPRADLRDFVID